LKNRNKLFYTNYTPRRQVWHLKGTWGDISMLGVYCCYF